MLICYYLPLPHNRFMMKIIKNPCIQVCRYDKDDICYGCSRTKEEAQKWIFYNDEEKLQVLKNIETRKAQDNKPEMNNYDHYV